MASAPLPGADLQRLRADADRFLGLLLDTPVDARQPMLDALARDDEELHALVSSLFAHVDEVDDFLAEPIAEPTDPASDDDGADFVGRRLGHWKIVRPIGRGGMGLVFEVERADGVVRQRAALKLIKRTFDNRSIVARFHTERQILAQLDHPSIGRLIDAGAAQGRPYLVMEFIDGVPLDRWSAAHRLSIDGRLALFVRICDAVHYAHQRLVVHRDLKPSNILVTEDGTPKLLDFGISKLIGAGAASAASAETIDASTLLTPRYASPEQLTGAPISTASDVYSLGVLLFELLTGTTPYRTRNDSLVDMMRAVMTESPSRASVAAAGMTTPSSTSDPDEPARADDGTTRQRVRRLRGDIDLILAKALAKEPADRYESAAALRDDLARHLAGEPIRAAAPTWRYRAAKFTRRHRVAVATAAIVAVTVVGLAVVATWQGVRAERARAVADAQRLRAERRFDDTRSLARAMLTDLNDAIATGPTKAREQLVRTALTYLDRLSQDSLSPDLQRDVADGYEKIADILGNQATDNLGQSGEAATYLAKALAIRTQLASVAPDDVANLRGLISVDDSLGHLARFAGHPDEASRHFAAGTASAQRLVALRPDDPQARLALFARRRAQALIEFAPGRPSLNRFGDAVRDYRALIVDLDAYAATHPGLPRLIDITEISVHELGVLQRLNGDAVGALASAQRDLAICDAVARAHPDDHGAARDLAVASRGVGDALLELGRSTEGMDMLARSMDIRRASARADPTNARADRDVAIGHSMLGFAYDLAGRPRAALVEYQAWAQRASAASLREPTNVGHRLDLVQARWSVADMHLLSGQRELAISEARQVESDVLAFDEATRHQDAAREALGKARLIVARGLSAQHPSPEAFAIAVAGLESLDANRTQTPEDAFADRDFARAQVQAGTIGYLDGHDRAAGCRLLVEGRTRLHALRAAHRLTEQFTPVLVEADAAASRCAA